MMVAAIRAAVTEDRAADTGSKERIAKLRADIPQEHRPRSTGSSKKHAPSTASATSEVTTPTAGRRASRAARCSKWAAG